MMLAVRLWKSLTKTQTSSSRCGWDSHRIYEFCSPPHTHLRCIIKWPSAPANSNEIWQRHRQEFLVPLPLPSCHLDLESQFFSSNCVHLMTKWNSVRNVHSRLSAQRSRGARGHLNWEYPTAIEQGSSPQKGPACSVGVGGKRVEKQEVKRIFLWFYPSRCMHFFF